MADIMLQEAYVLYAAWRLGAMTPAQMTRYLFENQICGTFELKSVLAKLKEEDSLKQAVSINGITYELTESGTKRVAEAKEKIGSAKQEEMDRIGEELQKRFHVEKDYLARYSEQATGIIPLFLSLREGDKILMKVNVIVPDAGTARVVAKKWPENAQKAYRALWDCIGEGLPFPEFEGILNEEKKEEEDGKA